MLITIEEKLELFEEIVFDRVKKENEAKRKEFEQKYGKLVSEKKAEFTRQAEKLLKDTKKEIEQEKTRLVSKAKIEKKRIIRQMEKKIFDECMEGLLAYGKRFRETPDYEKTWQQDLAKVLSVLEGDEIEVFCNEKDINAMKAYFDQVVEHKQIQFTTNNAMIGGFIIADREHGVQYDLTIEGKIISSQEKIGTMLVQSLTKR